MNSSRPFQLSIATILLFLTVSLVSSAQKKDFVCPPVQEILPCECMVGDDLNREKLLCVGQGVNQDTINNLFTTVRAVNNISDGDWLNVATFFLSGTGSNLGTLDLTPFAKTNLWQFYLFLDSSLSAMVGGTNSSAEIDIEPFRFSVEELDLHSTDLTDSMVAELLKFLIPENLTGISISGSPIQGGGVNSSELIPGLSAFTQVETLVLIENQIDGLAQDQFKTMVGLDTLNLGSNKIQTLAGGQFRSNKRLTGLTLAANLIKEVGQDAFLFDGQPDPDMVNVKLVVELYENGLTDDSFLANNGLQSIGRPVSLNVAFNNFETISAQNFEPFLQANEANTILLRGNPITCDERVRWLRDQKDIYESRVREAECANDVGQTIFTTELLS